MLRSLFCGVDVGGTFTDVVVLDSAARCVVTGKVLTTPADPSEGVLRGIREVVERLPECSYESVCFVHATTIVTNALIERRGVRTALVTTRGFQDVLDLRRENRYDIFDLDIEFPEPIVPSGLRWEVSERVGADGSEILAIDPIEIGNVAESMKQAEVKSVALVLLHAYADPRHERDIAALLGDHLPQVPISMSSAVAPRIGEYERTTTTAINAYVRPLVDSYLRRVASGVRRIWAKPHMTMMLSNGGTASLATARQNPVRLLESGPAAGALAGQFYSDRLNEGNVLAFDMGGTTAKLCIIQEGKLSITEEFEAARSSRFQRGSGIPVSIPSIDLVEIGAGGGSIASVDDLGLLQVGPRSAGADPGPACYSLGGQHATVTDADLVLGYLDADYFLAGTMELDTSLAAAALQRDLAVPLNLSLQRAAWGVHDLVNEHMASAARLHSAAAGLDPRACTLIATGGAGPVHAVHLAASLGINHVVCPPAPGVASAFGLLVAPPRVDLTRTLTSLVNQLDTSAFSKTIDTLTRSASAMLRQGGSQTASVHCAVQMAYVGQAHHIDVALAPSEIDPRALRPLLHDAFETAYRELFGATVADGVPQIVGVRITALGQAMNSSLPRISEPAQSLTFKPRLVCTDDGRDWVSVDVYHRSGLTPELRQLGPAIIQDEDSSMLIEVGWKYWVDEDGVVHATQQTKVEP